MDFNVETFMQPLNIPTILLILGLGLGMGTVLASQSRRLDLFHAYWMWTGGAVFFIPLAIFRGAQGAPDWERLLGVYVLWLIYIFGFICAGWAFRKRCS